MIVTLTLNPSVDHTLFLEAIALHDTNRVIRSERDAGGKGINISRMAVRLGASTVATGFLGGGVGANVRTLLDQQSVPHRFIEIEGTTRVNFCVEDHSGLPPTTFNAPGPCVGRHDLDELAKALEVMLKGASWLTLGGSVPPGLSHDVLIDFIRLAREFHVKVALDADGETLRQGIGAGPNLVKPNAAEAERLLGRRIESLDDALAAAMEIQAKMAAHNPLAHPMAVLSRGDKPAVLACHDGVFVGYPPTLEPRSTIGCGDSMIAGMLCALDQGMTMEEGFAWGMAAGAATAESSGSDIGTFEATKRNLESVRIEKTIG